MPATHAMKNPTMSAVSTVAGSGTKRSSANAAFRASSHAKRADRHVLVASQPSFHNDPLATFPVRLSQWSSKPAVIPVASRRSTVSIDCEARRVLSSRPHHGRAGRGAVLRLRRASGVHAHGPDGVHLVRARLRVHRHEVSRRLAKSPPGSGRGAPLGDDGHGFPHPRRP